MPPIVDPAPGIDKKQPERLSCSTRGGSHRQRGPPPPAEQHRRRPSAPVQSLAWPAQSRHSSAVGTASSRAGAMDAPQAAQVP